MATRVGGIPGLTGEDAALLVPPGDAPALAAAVRSVLTDPPLAARLKAAAAVRAATLPSEADAVSAALMPAPQRGAAPVCDNRLVPLTSTCLCLLTRTGGDGAREVLLGYKKTGFGTGKIVALGGHVEPGESAAEAAAREVKEESGIRVAPGSLTAAAHLTFPFPAHPSWDMEVDDLHRGELVRRAGRVRRDQAPVVPGHGAPV